MRRRPKYKLPRRGNSPGQAFYWLLALGLVALIGWVWWKASDYTRTPAVAARPQTRPTAPFSQPSSNPASLATPVVPRPVAIPVPAPTNFSIPTPPPVPPPAFAADPGAVRGPPEPSIPGTNPLPVVVAPPPPPPPPDTWPRPAADTFEAQVALLQHGISCGSLDGAAGSQTRAALLVFQHHSRLPETGTLDPATGTGLTLPQSPWTTYVVSSNDLARLQPIARTWLGKSKQTALDYETILELVAEKHFAHPGLIRRLNPGVDWNLVRPGARLKVPRAAYPEPRVKAALIRIHLADKTLEAFDSNGRLLAHFPCSIAHRAEKRPVGDLHVAGIAPHPTYTFDPDVFPESVEAHKLNRRLILPPGPNNPVGVAWIGLDKPGYGIHGTPSPEEVGRTESHGCFRLANWNAAYLVRLVNIGTLVRVTE